jgi:hypothetical protein
MRHKQREQLTTFVNFFCTIAIRCYSDQVARRISYSSHDIFSGEPHEQGTRQQKGSQEGTGKNDEGKEGGQKIEKRGNEAAVSFFKKLFQVHRT